MTSLVTAAQLAELRRMVAEPSTTTYGDALLTTYIEKYPLMDSQGIDPTYLDYSSTPPLPVAEPCWIPTYDLHAAAADVWEEKAAPQATKSDFSSDGGNYSMSQKFEMAMKMVKFHRARRAVRNIDMIKKPLETNGLV